MGLNHDIGCEFSKFGLSHNKIGGDILNRNCVNSNYIMDVLDCKLMLFD